MYAEIKQYCLEKPEVSDSYPWKGKKSLAFKVIDKLFAALDEDKNPIRLNVKMDKAKRDELQSRISSVLPHPIHKETWATILLDGSIDFKGLCEIIDDSYMSTVKTLKKKDRDRLLSN